MEFPIKARGKRQTDASDLHDTLFDYIEPCVRKLATGKGAKEVLVDYFVSSRGDVVAAAIKGRISFNFRSPAGACDMSCRAAQHWADICLLLMRPAIDDILREHGWAFATRTADLQAYFAKEGRYPLVELKGRLYCVVGGDPEPPSGASGGIDGQPSIFSDDHPDNLSFEGLSRTQKQRVLRVAKSGQCECPVCKKVRSNKARTIDIRKIHKSMAAASKATNLSRALRSPRWVKQLDLYETGLSELSPEVGTLVSLTELDLGYNYLTALPGELGQLTKLETLSLRNNYKLASLPGTLRNLTKLKRLDLGNTTMRSLPAWLTKLDELQHLSLSFCPAAPIFKPFPAVLRKLVWLKVVEISSAEEWTRSLATFPWDRFTQLEEVSLWHCDLKKIPETLTKCTKLAKLDLLNPIASLPKSLSNLENLESLCVTGRGSRVAEISPLRALRNLKWLNISDNPIEDIRPLARLSRLETLHLDKTQVRDLTPLKGLKKLEYVSVSEDGIDNVQIRALKKALPRCEISVR